MKGYAEKIKRLLAFVLFMVLIIYVWIHLSYLMRYRSDESEHITGLNNASDIDVAFIGGSSVEVYWEPYRAWSEYGFTSYDYSVSGIMMGDELGKIREIRNKISPSLIVIETRTYAWREESYKSYFEREALDQMNINLNRFLTAREAIKAVGEENLDNPNLSYYFDIMKYHINTDNFAKKEAWNFINNDVKSSSAGYYLERLHNVQIEPEEWPTDSLPLNPYAEKCLRRVLSYANEHDINILFVTMPYVPSEEYMMRHNTVDSIIAEYGVPSLNLCKDSKELNLDYEKDFYNARHVSVYGAEKVTNYLGNYISKNYNLKDNRNDPSFSSWNERADLEFKEDEKIKKWVDKELARKRSDHERAQSIKEIDSFPDWYAAALGNESLSIFVVRGGQGAYETSGMATHILSEWNMTKSSGEKPHWTHTLSLDSDDVETTEDAVQGKIKACESIWMITPETASIVIDGREQSLQKEGINVVLWDNNYNCLVDRFVLTSDGDGGVVLNREDL